MFQRDERPTTLSVNSLMKPSTTDDMFKRSAPARRMTLDDFASSGTNTFYILRLQVRFLLDFLANLLFITV